MAYKLAGNTVIDSSGNGCFYCSVCVNIGCSIDVGVATDTTATSPMAGTVSGYTAGGCSTSLPFPYRTDRIDKFPFATDTNATTVGSLTSVLTNSQGSSSQENGYITGGDTGPATCSDIQKWPFASDTNATCTASLAVAIDTGSGHSSSFNGYTVGGTTPPGFTPLKNIQKFPFATDTNASTSANLASGVRWQAGLSHLNYGYIAGGLGPGSTDVIQRFSFASDQDASVARATLACRTYYGVGVSSIDAGYVAGGDYGGGGDPSAFRIQKFSYESDAVATCIGCLTEPMLYMASSSSEDNGYIMGGYPATVNNAGTTKIEKFPFASDTNASCIGALTQARRSAEGVQD